MASRVLLTEDFIRQSLGALCVLGGSSLGLGGRGRSLQLAEVGSFSEALGQCDEVLQQFAPNSY